MAFSSAKLVSLFASVVALATMGSQLSLAQQSPGQNTTPPANSQQNTQPQSIEELLGLSKDQIQQITNILAERKQRIEKILNQNQLQIIEEARLSRQAPDPAKLNLTSEQQTRIASIYEDSGNAIRKVLTPEQLKKLEAEIQQNQNRPR